MKVRGLLAAAVVAVLAVPPGARAAEEHAAYAGAYNYLPSRIEIRRWDSLTLTNLDLELHTLTAVDLGPDGKPLFDTGANGVDWLDTEAVAGVAGLGPGEYAFYCWVHPELPTLRGTIVVGEY